MNFPSARSGAKTGATPLTRAPQSGRLRHSRSLFLSDLHLGAKSARPARVLEFLNRNSADTIYLVGDIFDTWQPMKPNWSPLHDTVVQTLLERAQTGTRLVYLPGNHDTLFRQHCGLYFGIVEVCEQVTHTTANGQRFLVLHGDIADAFVKRHQWIGRLGAMLDSQLRRVSGWLNHARRQFDLPPQTLIEGGIAQFNALLRQGNRFEARLVDLARTQGHDGVICGHFHKPALHEDFGLTYANCGDWVENFTAIAEDAEGNLCLLGSAARPLAAAVAVAPDGVDDAPPLAS